MKMKIKIKKKVDALCQNVLLKMHFLLNISLYEGLITQMQALLECRKTLNDLNLVRVCLCVCWGWSVVV